MDGWTADRARAWVDARPRRWPRGALIALGVAAIAAAMFADTVPCSPSDPSICGPDPTFASVAVLAAALLAGWWYPTLAAFAAVLFAGLDLALDDNPAARIAFSVWALLHVAHVVYVRRARARQLRLAAAAVTLIPRDWPRRLELGRASLLHRLGLAAILIGIVVAGAATIQYRAEIRADAELARAALIVDSEVVAVDPDDILTVEVRLSRSVPGHEETLTLSTFDGHPVGTSVPVRVNPQDPAWAHPVAEPPDRTHWLLLAAFAAVTGLGLTLISFDTDLRRRRLTAMLHTSGVPVRVLRVPGTGGAGIACLDEDVVCAETPLDIPLHEEALAVQAVADHPEIVQAQLGFVVGDLREGGLVGVLTSEVTALGSRPITILPEVLPFDETWASAEEEELDTLLARSAPIAETAEPARLPLTLAAPPMVRAKGLLKILAALGLLTVALWVPEEADLIQVALTTLALGALLVDGFDDLLSSLTVSPSAVTLRSTWRDVTIPLTSVHAVRHTADSVILLDDTADSESNPTDEDHGDVGVIVLDIGAGAPSVAAAIDAHREPLRTDLTRSFDHTGVTQWRWSAAMLLLLLAGLLAAAVRAAII